MQVWDVATGKPRFLLSGHEDNVNALASPRTATGWSQVVTTAQSATGTSAQESSAPRLRWPTDAG